MSMNHLKCLFRLNHESLSKQGPFWLSIFIPLIISILLCIPLWAHTTIDLSSDGYGKFLEMYKLPIGILSLTIPLVAIVAHIHRTIQTSEQIRSARDKSRSDSFFLHHKFVIDALSKIPPKTLDSYEYKIEDPYSIYAYLFEDASYTKGVNIESLEKAKKEFTEIINKISASIESAKSDESKNSRIHDIYNIAIEMSKLESKLSITKTKRTWHSLIMENDGSNIKKFIIPFHNESELKKRLDIDTYFIKKTFQIVNIIIDVNENIDFYSHIDEPDHMIFSTEFKKSVRTKSPFGSAFSNITSKSNPIMKEYDEYLIALDETSNNQGIKVILN
ncbi:hypothetical protein CBW53_06465 [Yersinia frederiksenii]|nr:hypothetical protein CBW53_06465 [Yersinia frederiksenii]CNI14466.1 Uncharacterised protein [Yersinia frederiksenii]